MTMPKWMRPPEPIEIPISVLETLVRELSRLVEAQTAALQSKEPKLVSVLDFGGGDRPAGADRDRPRADRPGHPSSRGGVQPGSRGGRAGSPGAPRLAALGGV
jgi:hypothetical protein